MELDIKIYNKINQSEYLDFLKDTSPNLDIYYQPDFLSLEAEIQQGEYEVFTACKENKAFIYPYIKLPFAETFSGYSDITSPYGYSGPYTSDDIMFIAGENSFMQYAIDNKFVAEFIRYHYLYNDKNKFSIKTENLLNRTIVTIDLSQTWQKIWEEEFSSPNRNRIRKLEKEGFQYTITEQPSDIDDFIALYYHTMKNANADPFYFFDKGLLKRLYKQLGTNIILAKVFKDNKTYSSGLFFVSGGIITYYLGARNIEHPDVAGTNFLFSGTIQWAIQNGIRLMNLGGGLTNDPDDFLFRFKKNFSRTYRPFFIGKRIHNTKNYELLRENFIHTHGRETYEQKKNILQFYR